MAKKKKSADRKNRNKYQRKYAEGHPEKVKGWMKKYRDKNKTKIRENQRRYYHNNKATVRATIRKSILKIKYGLTIEDFNLLYDKQNGRCAICGKHQSELTKSLVIDHNHQTQKVRGLLCVSCNLVLGNLKIDNGFDLIYKVLNYVK